MSTVAARANSPCVRRQMQQRIQSTLRKLLQASRGSAELLRPTTTSCLSHSFSGGSSALPSRGLEELIVDSQQCNNFIFAFDFSTFVLNILVFTTDWRLPHANVDSSDISKLYALLQRAENKCKKKIAPYQVNTSEAPPGL